MDFVEYICKMKWRWAGHVARMTDNRWTIRSTEWTPRDGRRSVGRLLNVGWTTWPPTCAQLIPSMENYGTDTPRTEVYGTG